MKLSIKVDGDLRAIYGTSIKEGKRAVQGAVAAAGSKLQANWRGQIASANLGPRLQRTIRKAVYPVGHDSFNAAALVWTKAQTIIDAFERGVTISSANGFYLAIPLPAAGPRGVGRQKITPAGFEQRTGLRLRFVYRRNNYSLLVADGRQNSKGRAVASKSKTGRGAATVPVFLLIKQVRLPKKLSLLNAATAAQDGLAQAIVNNWREDT